MSALQEIKLTATTDGSGDATVYAESSIMGFLVACEWVDGDFVDGVDAVLSTTNTGSGVDQTLLTLTNANDDAWYHVRTLEDDETGAALTTRTYPLVNGVLQLVVSNGGATKTGSLIAYVLV